MVTIRQATLADREAIFNFIKQAYPGRWQYKIPERWEWLYVNNPYLKAAELPLWIAVDSKENVVGQTGALVEPLVIGGDDFRVGWSVDTFLLPEYRGQGLGRKLQQANDEANPIFMSLSMSDANRHIKTSLGSILLEPVSTYIKTLHHTPERALNEFLDRLGLASESTPNRLADSLQVLKLDQALAWLMTSLTARRISQELTHIDPTLQIESVGEIGPEFDQLWRNISPHYRALIRRDQTYLKRKYADQPHTNYHCLVARKAEKICGYLFLRAGRPPEPNRGILTDLFAAPDDGATIFALLAIGVVHLQRLGVESISTGTNLPLFQETLEAFQFRPTKPATPMVHCRVATEACETLYAPGAWLLGKGDHDWDQFPLG